ncbi:metallophosphoesterase [Brachybacterium sp. NPDC056505]|uniref:metallophosphoesterase n=1 Tax=Brachybacterium sp. NPDC056505 TaxID=3345843 RepID=UPI00366AC151
MPSYYALSDIHGHREQFAAALDLIGLDRDADAHLMLLGDYVDRGPDSAGVLQLAHRTHQRYGGRVVALLGNHDTAFLDWLDGDDEDYSWLLADRDFTTVRSFLSPLELADALGHESPGDDSSDLDGETMNRNLKRAILGHHGRLVAWMRRLPLVHETEHHIWVHAGLDEEAGELWRQATPDYVFTEKYPASVGSHEVGKTIVAGHVQTFQLHGDPEQHTVYADHGHIYIDGSVEVTGRLNVLHVGENCIWSERSVGASAIER